MSEIAIAFLFSLGFVSSPCSINSGLLRVQVGAVYTFARKNEAEYGPGDKKYHRWISDKRHTFLEPLEYFPSV